jgi:hypothetical protein
VQAQAFFLQGVPLLKFHLTPPVPRHKQVMVVYGSSSSSILCPCGPFPSLHTLDALVQMLYVSLGCFMLLINLGVAVWVFDKWIKQKASQAPASLDVGEDDDDDEDGADVNVKDDDDDDDEDGDGEGDGDEDNDDDDDGDVDVDGGDEDVDGGDEDGEDDGVVEDLSASLIAGPLPVEEDSLLPLVAQETFHSVSAVSDDAAAAAAASAASAAAAAATAPLPTD